MRVSKRSRSARIAVILTIAISGILTLANALPASAATLPVYYNTVSESVGVKDLVGSTMSVTVTQQYGYTGENVYSVSSPAIRTQIGTGFQIGGYQYGGVQSTSFVCTPYQGHSRGYCTYYAQFKFTANQYGINLGSWSPWIEFQYYFNGTAWVQSSNYGWTRIA